MIDVKTIREQVNQRRRDMNPKDPGISQADVAAALTKEGHEISQAQVSRYEANPGAITLDLLVPWLNCLGTTVPEAMARADRTPIVSLDAGAPYAELHDRLDLVDKYFSAQPESVSETLKLQEISDAIDFKRLMRSLRRKPNVVLAGKFDSGKTSMTNWLLGKDRALAEGYSPTTNVVTFIHDVADRPQDWPDDDVWLFDKTWSHQYWNVAEYSQHHKLVSGDLSVLRSYGTHQGEKGSAGARSALVFLDSPILKACNLVDLPGYSHDEVDSEIADTSAREMDALIYLSSTNGFFDSADSEYFRVLLRQLPIICTENNSNPLSNMWLVSTHAHMGIQAEDIKGMPAAAAMRIFRQMGEHEFEERSVQAMSQITEHDIASRIFPFYRESVSRCAPFKKSLERCLRDDLPSYWRHRANMSVDGFKRSSHKAFSRQINKVETLIQSISSAKQMHEDILANAEKRKKLQQQSSEEVFARIEELRQKNLAALDKSIEETLAVDHIAELVEQRYGKDKKAAQQEVPGYIKGAIEHTLRETSKELTDELKRTADQFLSGLEASLALDDGKADGQVIPFDAKGAFAGGLASVATVGGLAIWAGTLGNLGGYAAAATALGWVNIGGAAWMSGIAAIGGPVTLAIGIGAGAFFLAKALLGDNWQRRLAKQVHQQFTKPDKGPTLKQALRDAVNSHWDQAATTFRLALDAYEEQFGEHCMQIESLAKSEFGREEMEMKISAFKEARSFFDHIPWVPRAN